MFKQINNQITDDNYYKDNLFNVYSDDNNDNNYDDSQVYCKRC
jgi:hypothetical protein